MDNLATSACAQYEDRLQALHLASLEFIQDLSLEKLLERIAEIARQQTGARYAAVGVLDENGKLDLFIPVGMAPEMVKAIRNKPTGKGLLRILMRGQESIRIAKVLSDPRSAGFPRFHPLMKSFLGIPIRQAGRNLGQIYLADKNEGGDFSADDQQMIETLAAYAAIAISNARLYSYLNQRDQFLTRRNENLILLNELASSLASFTDIDETLAQVMGRVMEHIHLDVVEVFLLQGTSRMLKLVLHEGQSLKQIWRHKQFQFGEGTLGMAAQSGQPALIDLQRSNDHNLDPSVLEGRYQQLGCFPLNGRTGALGVLCVITTQPRTLDELDMQFLSIISSWMGMVIENSRLNIQQRRLSVMEERERIGMDLHDGVIQSIYAVGLTLENIRILMGKDVDQANQRIEQAIDHLNSTIRDIRSYILDLRPRQLHEEDLIQGIQRLMTEFRMNTLLEVNLQGSRLELQDLPESQVTALFLICQEALANIAKHARARHVEVSLWTSPDRALMEVHDDGRGFDFSKAKQSLGHGLLNMQTRARNVGGDLDITSEPGGGTTILAWVPFAHTPLQPAANSPEESGMGLANG